MRALRASLASLLILVGGVALLAHATDGFSAYTTESARRSDIRAHPRAVPDVLLQTGDSASLRPEALRGRWVLVDFVYTRCLTYCTVLGGDFGKLQASLQAPISAGKVALLSISFDPAFDDPARLAAYQRRYGHPGDGWIAARPTTAAGLDSLTRTFGITAVPDGLGGFVHNASIAVVNPQGRLVTILDWNDPGAAAQYVLQRLAP